MTPNDQYEMLVESLQLLAAPASEQVSALPRFVDVPDELVSTFGDAYLLVPQLEGAGLVQPEAAAALKRIDDYLSALPSDGSLSEVGSLETDERWKQLRSLAEAALASLGEPKRIPVLRQVRYLD